MRGVEPRRFRSRQVLVVVTATDTMSFGFSVGDFITVGDKAWVVSEAGEGGEGRYLNLADLFSDLQEMQGCARGLSTAHALRQRPWLCAG